MSAVTEEHRAVGSWEIVLEDVARDVLGQLAELGHIAITETRHTLPVDDQLLSAARFVGPVRARHNTGDQFTLTGAGMAWWLGTEDKTGAVHETAVVLTGAELTQCMFALLPGSQSVVAGSFHDVPGLQYTGRHQYQTPRDAIDYVCDYFGAEWRVNGDGTLDAGLYHELFVATPRAVIVRRDASDDMYLQAFPGPARTERDVSDFSTRVVLLGGVEENVVTIGSADLDPGLNPYYDIHGNVVRLVRMVSESATESGNAGQRARIQLERFLPQLAVTLDTVAYDFRGTIEVGDKVWVHDPDAGIVDPTNEVVFRGERMNPVLAQVTTMTWPVIDGMGVYYRAADGSWIDLSDVVVFADGDTTVEVGKIRRNFASAGNTPIGRF